MCRRRTCHAHGKDLARMARGQSGRSLRGASPLSPLSRLRRIRRARPNRLARYTPTASFIVTWTASARRALRPCGDRTAVGLLLRPDDEPVVLETSRAFRRGMLAGAQNRLAMNRPMCASS